MATSELSTIEQLGEQFKVTKPWRQPGFYAAIAASAAILIPEVPHEFTTHHLNSVALLAGVAPISAWLTQHGIRCAAAVKSFGSVVAQVAAIGGHPGLSEALNDQTLTPSAPVGVALTDASAGSPVNVALTNPPTGVDPTEAANPVQALDPQLAPNERLDGAL